MNTPLDVVSGIFRPEILDCIDPIGESLSLNSEFVESSTLGLGLRKSAALHIPSNLRIGSF